MDTSVTCRTYQTVHEGKLKDFQKDIPLFHSKVDPAAERLHRYGFCFDESQGQFFCRQAYDDAEGFQLHMANCKEAEGIAMSISQLALIEIHGPEAELARLRPILEPFNPRFYAAESGSKSFVERSSTERPDTMCELVPCFKVAEGKMEEFKALMPEFHAAMDPAAEKALYYGFGIDEEGGRVVCREAYEDADGLLKHIGNVDAQLKKALAISELERLEVHGPAEELQKLKEPLTPLGCKFYALEPGSRRWM